MIGLLCFVLAVVASHSSRRCSEAENAALRHQLIVLRRKLHGWVRPTNHDRWFFIVLYRWFPSILQLAVAQAGNDLDAKLLAQYALGLSFFFRAEFARRAPAFQGGDPHRRLPFASIYDIRACGSSCCSEGFRGLDAAAPGKRGSGTGAEPAIAGLGAEGVTTPMRWAWPCTLAVSFISFAVTERRFANAPTSWLRLPPSRVFPISLDRRPAFEGGLRSRWEDRFQMPSTRCAMV